jgi:hypothetical protein
VRVPLRATTARSPPSLRTWSSACLDKTNRACLAGRYSSQFIEHDYPDDYFSLRTLTHISD